MDLTALCPKEEKVWVTYYDKNAEPLFFLTGPVNTSSTLTAQSGRFTLYSLVSGAKGGTESEETRSGWESVRIGSAVSRQRKDARLVREKEQYGKLGRPARQHRDWQSR